MRWFYEAQEKYLTRLNVDLKKKIEESIRTYISGQEFIILFSFICYSVLIFLLVTLLRSKLIKDISIELQRVRGMMNLMPFDFFENNKEKVEKLI